MKFKKTRIAFSVVCGVLCVLLIGLWVRSYWWADVLCIRHSGSGVCPPIAHSLRGYLYLGGTIRSHDSSLTQYHNYAYYSNTVFLSCYHIDEVSPSSQYWEAPYSITSIGSSTAIPTCFVVALTGIAAALMFPYQHFQWRFSLKALLISITFISLALGVIIYLTKQ